MAKQSERIDALEHAMGRMAASMDAVLQHLTGNPVPAQQQQLIPAQTAQTAVAPVTVKEEPKPTPRVPEEVAKFMTRPGTMGSGTSCFSLSFRAYVPLGFGLSDDCPWLGFGWYGGPAPKPGDKMSPVVGLFFRVGDAFHRKFVGNVPLEGGAVKWGFVKSAKPNAGAFAGLRGLIRCADQDALLAMEAWLSLGALPISD